MSGQKSTLISKWYFMAKADITLPIFPLPIFLLPGGVVKLRIFEPRYLKMVGIALSNDGFVISLNDKNGKNNSENTAIQWGSWVEIIDFDQGADGILEINVKCNLLVDIKLLEQDSDNLNFGKVSAIKHWSQTHASNINDDLSSSLANVFSDNEHLNRLYTQKPLNDIHWVLARWLEILPVELSVKKRFVINHNFQEAKEFVESIIFT